VVDVQALIYSLLNHPAIYEAKAFAALQQQSLLSLALSSALLAFGMGSQLVALGLAPWDGWRPPRIRQVGRLSGWGVGRAIACTAVWVRHACTASRTGQSV
jgi:hypothetical protein